MHSQCDHSGHNEDWNVHFGVKIGNYLVIAFMIVLWLAIVLFVLTLLRRRKDRQYTQEQRQWLLTQVEDDLIQEEGETLEWHTFPDFNLAPKDAQDQGMGLLWQEPSGVSVVNPNLEVALIMLYFLGGHVFFVLYFAVWRGHYGSCPYPYPVIVSLFACVIIGFVVLPFFIERYTHKMPPIVIYAITTRRAILLRSSWHVWMREDALEQELYSYHLHRQSGAMQVETYRLVFETSKEENATKIEFQLINDPQEAYNCCLRCRREALTAPPLSPRSQSKSPTENTPPMYDLKGKLPWYKRAPSASPPTGSTSLSQALKLKAALLAPAEGRSAWAKPGESAEGCLQE